MSNEITLEQLDDKQRLAVEQGLDVSKRISAVAGPAGSGKTTIMRMIYNGLTEAGYTVKLAAPTGKAAKRIREATGLPAGTLHMLLEYTRPLEIDDKTGKPFGDTFPRRTKENPLECDVVIGDEYMMVNHELHRNLIDALQSGARLIVLGDVSQLPPIESSPILAQKPAPFKILLDKFNGIYLDKVHRTADDSGILLNAQRILGGTAPMPNTDFTRIITDKPVDELVAALDKADYTALNNQIITPANKSWVGTLKLNATLQTVLMDNDRHTLSLPRNKWDAANAVRVGVGDKVIMTKNWYDLDCEDGSKGVFNGEVGKVIEVSDVEEVVVDFDDRICRIPPAVQLVYNNKVTVGYPQRDIYLAYVVTTHKAQGSEYDHIVYVLNKSMLAMMNRKNMYTALTRARKHATLITDMASLSMSVTTKEPKVFSK
jgi:exodeoxyribonuclease V alpha subunit